MQPGVPSECSPPEPASYSTPVSATWDEKLKGKKCGICDLLRNEASMYVCDKCEECYHYSCVLNAKWNEP